MYFSSSNVWLLCWLFSLEKRTDTHFSKLVFVKLKITMHSKSSDSKLYLVLLDINMNNIALLSEYLDKIIVKEYSSNIVRI